MKKFGFYNGKEYKDGEEVNQCCFNISDILPMEEVEELKESHRQQCIACAVSSGYSSPCSPCQVMKQ